MQANLSKTPRLRRMKMKKLWKEKSVRKGKMMFLRRL
jgi:hypothetical protein